MSQQDLELVKEAIEAFNARDRETLERLCHDDYEFTSILTAIDAEDAVYRGSRAWTDYFAVMDEIWSEWRVKGYRTIDGGDGRLVTLVNLVGAAALSGVPFDMQLGMTYELRDGKLWRMRAYSNPDEALAALGLSAEDRSDG